MTYAEMILPEFDEEMANTRKVLERVPDDKLDWRPHPKSNTIGWNANHLADIPAWVEGIFTQTSYAAEGYQSPKLTSRKEILDLFDRNARRGPQGDRRREGRGHRHRVVAAAGGPADSDDAALHGDAELRAQSPGTPPRDPVRVSAAERHSRSRAVRPFGGRVAVR